MVEQNRDIILCSVVFTGLFYILYNMFNYTEDSVLPINYEKAKIATKREIINSNEDYNLWVEKGDRKYDHLFKIKIELFHYPNHIQIIEMLKVFQKMQLKLNDNVHII
jgi:hypothetical protein